ncbi:MAG: hypothetical protein ACLS5G_03980 [Streptococcus sp.]
MAISGFIFGFGPWVFNQILAFKYCGSLEFIAPSYHLFDSCFGNSFVLSLRSSHSYSYGLLFKSGLTFVISGLLYDTYHAVSTFYSIHSSVYFGGFEMKK